MNEAVILLGHGSRDPLWRRPMDAVRARLVQRSPGVAVRCAFLELNEPDLAAAARELAAQAVERVAIVPMFLGAGHHVREDLPRQVALLRQAHPRVTWNLRPPIGEDERLLDLLAELAAPSGSG